MDNEKIYITVSQKADLDSAVSIYIYERFQNISGEYKYIAALKEPPNHYIQWIFHNFQQELPRKVDSHLIQKNINLEAENESFCITTKIAQEYLEKNIPISPNLASLILSAILDTTFGLKAGKTTINDEIIAAEMASKAEVGDINDFTRMLFNKKYPWDSISAKQIISHNLKNEKNFTISEIEAMDSLALEKREDELVAILHNMEKTHSTGLRLLLINDILTSKVILLGIGEKVKELEIIFNQKLIKNQKLYLKDKEEVLNLIKKHYLNEQ